MDFHTKEQLRQLKNIVPSSDWKKQNKDILMSQISNQVNPGVSVDKKRAWDALTIFRLPETIGRPAAMLAVIAVMTFSAGIIGVKASEQSLPGDVFYPIKLTREKIQVGLTTSGDKKAQLHIEFAGKRLNELVEVKKKPIDKTEKKERINVAVKGLKDELSKAKDGLGEIDDELVAEPKKIIEVAQLVDQKAVEYKERLDKEINEDIEDEIKDDAEVKVTVDEALSATAEVSNQAVKVIIDQSSKEEADDEVKEGAKEVLRSKVGKITENTEKLEQALNEITIPKDSEEGDSLEDSSITDEEEAQTSGDENEDASVIAEGASQESNEGADTQVPAGAITNDSTAVVTIKTVAEQPKEVKILLGEAQALIDSGELEEAFEKINLSNTLVDQATGVVKLELNQPKIEPEKESSGEEQTSEDSTNESDTSNIEVEINGSDETITNNDSE